MIAGVHQRRTLYISQLNSWTAAGGGANMLHLNLPLHARRAACTLQEDVPQKLQKKHIALFF